MRNHKTLLSLVIGLVAGCASYDPAVFDERLRAATFDTYWEALADDYPYFELKNIDWAQARERYRDRAVRATTRIAFYHVLARMLSELDDWHVRLDIGDLNGYGQQLTMLPHSLVMVDRRLRVEWLAVDPPLGNTFPELVAIDGAHVWDPRLAEILLVGQAGSSCSLTLVCPDGARREVVLVRPQNTELKLSLNDHTILGERSGDIGYLALRTFSSESDNGSDDDATARIAQIDRELDRSLDTRALVIDVQDNTGGNSDVLFATLGRLLPERTLFGHGLWLYFGPFTFQGPRYVEPRAPCYHGEDVVLTSAQTCSAAEWFARTLQREGRAIIVGERTVGAEAGTRDVKGPDGSSLTFGWRWITDRDGQGLQDVGVIPQVDVPLSIELVRARGFDEANAIVQKERLRRALSLVGAEGELARLRSAAPGSKGRRWEWGREAKRARL